MGEPIRVADFQEDWEADKIAAVRKLTAVLRERMESTLIHTDDDAEEQLLGQLETVLQSDAPLHGQAKFVRSKALAQRLQEQRTSAPTVFGNLKERAESYFKELNRLKLTDLAISGQAKAAGFLMILAFPFFLTGYLLHFLPAFFTKKLSDTLSTDKAWTPTYKTGGGLIVYPLTLWLQYLVLQKGLSFFVETENWLKWSYLLALVPMGLIAEWFIGQWQIWRANQRFRSLGKQQPQQKAALVALREEVLSFHKKLSLPKVEASS
jgi:hypothetical protein